jgi:hypothetical protein
MAASTQTMSKVGNHLDVAKLIKTATTAGDHSSWTQAAPVSLLLTLVGSKTAAVAKLVDVSYDQQVSPTGWGNRMSCEPRAGQWWEGGLRRGVQALSPLRGASGGCV